MGKTVPVGHAIITGAAYRRTQARDPPTPSRFLSAARGPAEGGSYNRAMPRNVLLLLAAVALLVLPQSAMGGVASPKVVPNVVRLEAGAGIRALFKSGVRGIGRYTINCPTLHVGKSLRIAWQSPAAGTAVRLGQHATIIVARQAQPKRHRTDPLPHGLSRAGLCALVSG